jgi:hypothetical protein
MIINYTNSVASQAEGREFEPRFSLKHNSRPNASLGGCCVFLLIRSVWQLEGVIKITMPTTLVTLKSIDGEKRGESKPAR